MKKDSLKQSDSSQYKRSGENLNNILFFIQSDELLFFKQFL